MKIQHYIFLAFSLLATTLAQNAHAVSCGDAITTDVTLTADMHCTTGFAALEVFANDVTIDLNGYRLTGSSALAGVLVNGFHNLEIKGGIIGGFWAGVNSSNSNGLLVHNNLIANVGHAVIITSGNNARIYANDILYATSDAVVIRNAVAGNTANNNRIEDNEFYQNFTGVLVCGDDADRNIIRNNLIWQSSDYGISLIRTSGNLVTGNDILDTGDTGVRMIDASRNRIRGNALRQGRMGIVIYTDAGGACLDTGAIKSRRNRISGNHVFGFDTGIFLGLGTVSSAEVYRNRINDNKIYNDSTGIFFNTDAHRNNASGNAFFGTTTAVTDTGVDNTY